MFIVNAFIAGIELAVILLPAVVLFVWMPAAVGAAIQTGLHLAGYKALGARPGNKHPIPEDEAAAAK